MMKIDFSRTLGFRIMLNSLSIFSAIFFLSAHVSASEMGTIKPIITNPGVTNDTVQSSVELSISSNPDGAVIFIDNAMAGITPFKGVLKPGMLSIRLEKNGYQACKQKIKLSRDQRLHFELQLEATAQSKSESETKKPSEVEETASRTPRDKSPPKIILADDVNESMVHQKQIVLSGKAVDDSGISLVMINGRDTPVDSVGRFEQTIDLSDGKNVIEIVALDKVGNKRIQTIAVHRQTIQTAPAENQKPSFQELSNWYKTQYALIIGIDRYKRKDIGQLKNAVNDAKSVAEIMTSHGFIVSELYNDKATRQNILNAYSSIHEKSKESDSFLFYFAGHGQGITINSQEKLGYLIPYDADVSLGELNLIQYDNCAINLNQLNHYAKNMKAKHVALLLDSCFSGLAMTRSVPKAAQSDHEYYEDLLSRKAINILTAGDDQPVSDGTEHSPFTRAIINAIGKKGIDLHDRDGYATFNHLAIYVKEKVEKDTARKQRPQFDNLSSEDGAFIFKFR